ncbi:hypothetical protein [Rossellomorea vietnamensis]|uniref:hypothetical protein n=1 Tax=Rossellomorea vietnamensis TaxID=218284 RepID=UPI001653A896|nr:hypothetical protein [Rossellomorea vietnamensis]
MFILVRLDIEVEPPDISKETMKEMSAFFLKTSIPRILADMKKTKEQEEEVK